MASIATWDLITATHFNQIDSTGVLKSEIEMLTSGGEAKIYMGSVANNDYIVCDGTKFEFYLNGTKVGGFE